MLTIISVSTSSFVYFCLNTGQISVFASFFILSRSRVRDAVVLQLSLARNLSILSHQLLKRLLNVPLTEYRVILKIKTLDQYWWDKGLALRFVD